MRPLVCGGAFLLIAWVLWDAHQLSRVLLMPLPPCIAPPRARYNWETTAWGKTASDEAHWRGIAGALNVAFAALKRPDASASEGGRTASDGDSTDLTASRKTP